MKTRQLVMPPGAFRLVLACTVFGGHLLPVSLGAAAVDLFFALSGYWIYRMWHAEYASLDRAYVTFLISRIWRLLPVFYATVAVAALCIHPLGILAFPLPIGWSWASINFYVSHLVLLGYAQLLGGPNVLIPTVWSLDVELQFYLIAPLVIWLLDRTVHRSNGRVALYLLAAAGLAYLFGSLKDWPAKATLPLYFGFFLAGMVTARHAWQPTRMQAHASLGCAALLLFGCIALPHARELFLWGSFTGPLTRYTLQANGLVALLMIPYAMATVRQLGTRRDRAMGNLSYEVYLVHGAALTIFLQHFEHLSRLARLPWMALTVLIVAVLCGFIYQYVDEPCERLRRAYVKAQRQPAASAASAIVGTSGSVG